LLYGGRGPLREGLIRGDPKHGVAGTFRLRELEALENNVLLRRVLAA
jgi:hypothetical protein